MKEEGRWFLEMKTEITAVDLELRNDLQMKIHFKEQVNCGFNHFKRRKRVKTSLVKIP